MKSLALLSILSLSALLSELFNFKKRFFFITLVGLLVITAFACYDFALLKQWGTDSSLMNNLKQININNDYLTSLFNNMLVFDEVALVFMILISFIAFLWCIMSQSYFVEETGLTDHYALILFALVGAFIMCSFNNMVMLFLGIEILSLSLYVLVGSRKLDLKSNEAALKYFLMGSFASGFLLFGIALVYGATGSFSLEKIEFFVGTTTGSGTQMANLPSFFYAGVLMLVIAMAFKISAVPFHFWAPDVYQGAPTPITAFMSTIVKTAAIAALMRIFFKCFIPIEFAWINIFLAISVLTLAVGNITAVYQTSVKRMLAYSSIAHAGYMLIPIVALVPNTYSSVFYYALAYSFASLIAFTILINVTKNGKTDAISSFNGLAKKNPILSFCMTLSLLSLAGIPPLGGFFAKYYLFTTALQSGLVGLVICAVIASLIGVYYYFKIIIAMYFTSSEDETSISVSNTHLGLILFVSGLLLLIGLFPNFLIEII